MGNIATWERDGVTHELTHLNEDHRAGRTACSRYVEFWPDEIGEALVTCLTCLGAPPLALVDAREAEESVDDRWEDVVRHCGVKHLTTYIVRTNRCAFCGYAKRL